MAAATGKDARRMLLAAFAELGRDRAYLDKFRARQVEDMVGALTWADSTFEAQARMDVSARVTYLLNLTHEGKLLPLEMILDNALDEALRRGTERAHSTSASSNLLEDCLRAAWCEATKRLVEFKKYNPAAWAEGV